MKDGCKQDHNPKATVPFNGKGNHLLVQHSAAPAAALCCT
jgi:hypothetical protein